MLFGQNSPLSIAIDGGRGIAMNQEPKAGDHRHGEKQCALARRFCV